MMTNTALSAKGEKKTRKIIFKNKQHEKFYFEYLPQCRYQDVYHKALVYCLGISEDTEEQLQECRRYTVEDLFCCGYARYFWGAIKIRYPEYCHYDTTSETANKAKGNNTISWEKGRDKYVLTLGIRFVEGR